MHGDGTKLGTTTNNPPPARLLDLTRLIRRAGRVLTGVDRVELAYLRAFLDQPVPLFALIRSRYGYILLNRDGMAKLAPWLAEPDTGNPPDQQNRRALRLARRVALGRVPPPLLARMLRRHLPQGTAYVNVGHSNLSHRVLRTAQGALKAQITVLIHDVIPLEHPEMQRAGTVPAFAAMIERVGQMADLIIYNSADTQARAARYVGTRANSIVAYLGTEVATPLPDTLPTGLPPARPYFVCIGTIEPRKNHAFLLDVWDDMGAHAPTLVIAGSRGWKNEDVFARLDRLPPDAPVQEVSGLSDGALAALVQRSAGVLFPTHAEGFGLPATEAAAAGVPLIVNELAVFREILGKIPIYASVSDRYLWKNKIKELAEAEPDTRRPQHHQLPTWDAHFKTVLRLT
ncbi:MAG: glycosyltransferase [Pseudomonadota bacterium]